MSAIRRVAQYMGFDVNNPDEYAESDQELAPVTNLHDVSEVKHAAPRTGAVKQASRAPREGASFAAADLRRIQTVKPHSYNDARLIGEAFRQGVPVIMNLSEMSDADAKRLVDFSAGLAFGLHGALERVAPNVFLISPAHVEIGMDEERSDQAFYNQG